MGRPNIGGSRLASFYKERPEHAPFAPDEMLRRSGMQWAAKHGAGGVPLSREALHQVEVDPEMGAQIGAAYQKMPLYSGEGRVQRSYSAFREETKRQFDFLTGSRSGGLGIDVEATPGDPYGKPADMLRDLRENRRLKVLSSKTTGEHPFLEEEENDMFRAVHDAFGHAASGRSFDRHGEEAAWLSHSRMYSDLARPAMTSETRGQNSAMIFSLGGKEFPEQKVGLLPARMTDPRPQGRRSARRAAYLNKQQFSLG